MVGGQGSGIFDLTQGKTGLDAGHHRNDGQTVEQQTLVFGQILAYHRQHEILLSAHQIALDDLRSLADGVGKHFQRYR